MNNIIIAVISSILFSICLTAVSYAIKIRSELDCSNTVLPITLPAGAMPGGEIYNGPTPSDISRGYPYGYSSTLTKRDKNLVCYPLDADQHSFSYKYLALDLFIWSVPGYLVSLAAMIYRRDARRRHALARY